MLSIKPLTVDSFPFALLKKGEKVKETLYYTEPTRGSKLKPEPLGTTLKKYLGDPSIPGALELTEDYSFEMLPTIAQVEIKKEVIPSPKTPRFINYFIAPSNSGKSFQIANMCRRYLEMWPENTIAYASANNIEADPSFDGVRDKIKIVDVLNLESTIDFTNPEYHNSLFIFDDCDSGFTVSMEDLDSRLTKEEMEKMTVTDKQKALKMLKAKCLAASEWVSKSIQSFMMNGRKFSISMCLVAHKPFDGSFENKIVNEASGIVTFPASIKKNLLKRFIVEKLGFEKTEAEEMIAIPNWYQYDYLYLSHRTSRPFVLSNTFLKIYD